MSLAEELRRTPEETAALLDAGPADASFGAFLDGAMVGIASFSVARLEKMRHKGFITGVYVQEAARGRGVARALMATVLDHAARHVEIVQCSVVTGNEAARRLYLSLGFVPFALEPQGLKVDGRYADEERLYLRLAGR